MLFELLDSLVLVALPILLCLTRDFGRVANLQMDIESNEPGQRLRLHLGLFSVLNFSTLKHPKMSSRI